MLLAGLPALPRKIASSTDLCESHARWHDSGDADGSAWIFDAEKRLAALSAKGDPLEAIDRLQPRLSNDETELNQVGLQERLTTPSICTVHVRRIAMAHQSRSRVRYGEAF